MGIFPKAEFIEPHPSSWSTSAQDIENKNPFPLWNNPDNHIHKYLWEHIGLCLELVNRANDASSLSPQSKQFAVMARSLLDRAFFSCHWWWATKRPMWDINIVNKGLILQEEAIFNAYKAINLGNLSESDKKISYYKVIGAIDASHKIRDLLFTS